MTVKSNQIRTITIEGVAFTPDVKGVLVPEDKIAKLKDNFFFKHYTDIGAFTVVEKVIEEQPKQTRVTKAK